LAGPRGIEPELVDGIIMFAGAGDELPMHDASESGGVTSEKVTECVERSCMIDIDMRAVAEVGYLA